MLWRAYDKRIGRGLQGLRRLGGDYQDRSSVPRSGFISMGEASIRRHRQVSHGWPGGRVERNKLQAPGLRYFGRGADKSLGRPARDRRFRVIEKANLRDSDV